MASGLVKAHIDAQARLREIVVNALRLLWQQLPAYVGIDPVPFVRQAAGISVAGQTQSAALTAAFVARALGVPAFGIDPAKVTGAAVRGGAVPHEVYLRPLITTWSALANGKPYLDAVSAGQARLEATGAVDVSLASRATFQESQDTFSPDDSGGPAIYGYQRVADSGACEFCNAIDGAYVKSANASPLHPRCGCGLEPLTDAHPHARWLPDGSHVGDGYATHTHGELGQVIGAPGDHFTTESEALSGG